MNVLFSTTSTVEFCNGKYYDNDMNATVPRYKRLGERMVCLVSIKHCNIPSQSPVDMENVEFVEIEKINTLKKLLWGQYRNKLIIKRYVEWADICVIHIPSFVGEYVAKCAVKQHKPYLTLVMGCAWDAYWNYNWKGKLLAPYRYYSLRQTVKKAEYVIYVTQHFLQRRYPALGHTIGCSNVKQDAVSEIVLNERLQKIHEMKKSNPIKLGTLAAVDVRYKGQEYVIRAIAELAKRGIKYEYHLGGKGEQAFLRNLAKHLGVSSQVIFYGSVLRQDLPTFLDNIDIYIQPSKQEGLPRALIEAMARACPALGADTAGIPELIDEDCIFRNGNVHDICNLLLTFDANKLAYKAKRNYLEACKYERTILEERRNSFMDAFLNDKCLTVQ